jgi:DNA-binding CsgD family transcriptional regulator
VKIKNHCAIGHLQIVHNLRKDNPLTAREMTCLMLLATGKNPEQCADLLNITYSSVLTYEKRIRQKLGVRNRVQAFYTALCKGYLKIKQ